jgi:oxygen-independent coproporphyrinogen-3 oxidase
MRVPWIGLVFRVTSGVLIVVPQTGQRLALSLRRVPQVGHNFVGLESGLIGFLYQGKIIPFHAAGNNWGYASTRACDMLALMESHSVYIHIPFCQRKCRYCDFTSFAGRQSDIPAYVDALCHEIEEVAGSLDEHVPIHTVYFGGGTPSLLPVNQYERILDTLRSCFDASRLGEITLEANPGTLDQAYLSRVFKAGVNRLSLGAQSAQPRELELLGRIHTVDQIRQVFQDARQAGFENINLDFMYGLPGQSTQDWQASLDLALELKPEHLSCYALTLEAGTPLAAMIAGGKLPEIDDDQAADCYEMTMDQLEAAGYRQYEISNWAVLRDGQPRVCVHNLQYWHNDPYLGFGVGAHGYSCGIRTANVSGIDAYLSNLTSREKHEFPRSAANETCLIIDEDTRLSEAMMVGLRLTDAGIARSHYIQRYQIDFYDKYHQVIDALIQRGLLAWVDEDHDRIRLTRKGRLLGNQVFMQFVGDEAD